jgi:hypothetical protein
MGCKYEEHLHIKMNYPSSFSYNASERKQDTVFQFSINISWNNDSTLDGKVPLRR